MAGLDNAKTLNTIPKILNKSNPSQLPVLIDFNLKDKIIAKIERNKIAKLITRGKTSSATFKLSAK